MRKCADCRGRKTSSVLDFKDRGTCILFGDGAGACVIGRTKRLKESILDVQISANGNFSNYLYTPRTLKPTPFNAKEEALEPFLCMKGNEVFKLAVKTLLKDAEMILEKTLSSLKMCVCSSRIKLILGSFKRCESIWILKMSKWF